MRERTELLDAARAARAAAYAPYSRFTVGAAVRSADGRTFTGSNVENASYGLSMCAERVAVFAAVGAGAHTLTAVAVAGPEGRATPPCGACRQVLAEFGSAELPVVYAGTETAVETTLGALLPDAFALRAP